MRSVAATKAAHIVTGNIFDHLGFSPSEASALKIKAEILSAVVENIRQKGYTQKQLTALLDEYQPAISNLLQGRIGQVSIERLLRYADRLGLETSVSVRPMARSASRPKRKPVVSATRRKLKSAI